MRFKPFRFKRLLLACLLLHTESSVQTYNLVVKYLRKIVLEQTLGQMSDGHRIHCGTEADGRYVINHSSFDIVDLITDYSRPNVMLPETNDALLKQTLDQFDEGIVLQTDKEGRGLISRTLCQSEVYFYAANDAEAEKPEDEPQLMKATSKHCLFSYDKFVNEWYRYLLSPATTPRPEAQSVFNLGRKPTSRGDENLISFSLMPQAAEVMLELADNWKLARLNGEEGGDQNNKIIEVLKLVGQ